MLKDRILKELIENGKKPFRGSILPINTAYPEMLYGRLLIP